MFVFSSKSWAGARKNLLAFAVGVAACAAIFIVADRTLAHLHERARPKPEPRPLYASGMTPDPLLGYRLLPELHLLDTHTVNGTTIYAVACNTDEHGRRIVPANAGRPSTHPFIAFFGCSFVFGEGGADEASLPNQVAARLGGYHVFNYGVPGYGTQHMLAALESGKLTADIQQTRGACVYVMIPSHLLRAAGTMRIAAKWGRDFPCYELDADNQLLYRGSFSSARPAQMRLIQLLQKSGLVRYFNLDYPPIRERDFQLVARLILQSRRLFESQFESLGFYVMLYPTQLDWGLSLKPLIDTLRQAGITVFDYSDFPITPERDTLHPKYDYHPNAGVHNVMAEKLAADMLPVLQNTAQTTEKEPAAGAPDTNAS